MFVFVCSRGLSQSGREREKWKEKRREERTGERNDGEHDLAENKVVDESYDIHRILLINLFLFFFLNTTHTLAPG